MQGGYLVGATNAIASLIVILYVERVGRKTILAAGQLAMTIALFFCGLAVLNQWNLTSFIMILLGIVSYHFSQGSVAWLYVPEVTVDAAAGLAVAAQFINLTILSICFEYMINSALQVQGTFWYFAGITFIGFLFMVFIVKETRGLEDVEKKTLYSPKEVAPNEA